MGKKCVSFSFTVFVRKNYRSDKYLRNCVQDANGNACDVHVILECDIF
jgi:hypothetical protein